MEAAAIPGGRSEVSPTTREPARASLWNAHGFVLTSPRLFLLKQKLNLASKSHTLFPLSSLSTYYFPSLLELELQHLKETHRQLLEHR
ncbi:hypothetical protein OPV22_009372 [Ensete ventricosum]|uniref:Uncharacterized protein n=1 Tax=Ensete ventricosum TaxID=4639 RepID=A0AAV8PR93_ENSVE|nr:hypothetical protein OPV22_009372 [Ensete ventricosum]